MFVNIFKHISFARLTLSNQLFQVSTVALLTFGLLLVSCKDEPPAEVPEEEEALRPNIVFIMVDDMGVGDLSSYGQEAFSTPHIDRLSKEGMRFTQAYAGCTVCAPSRSTLMTGQHTGHTPVRGNTGGIPLPNEAFTLAELLKEAGYVTGGFGKWGLGDIGTEGVPEKQGFDTFYGYYHQIHAHDHYPEYLIRNGEKEMLPGNAGFYANQKKAGPKPSAKEGLQHQFAPYLIAEEMKAWIRSHKDEAFFCYAPWTPPHAKYEIPETDSAWIAVKDEKWPLEAKIHAAFTMLIDRQVGEILDLLDELKLTSNTLFVFTSDNGAAQRFEGTLNSSGAYSGFKRSMYEGGLKVPFLMKWPEYIPAYSESGLPIYFPDMMPTFAELAGVSDLVPDSTDGISFVPTLLEGVQPISHQFMYWEWPLYDWNKGEYTGEFLQAVRHGKWKALRSSEQEPWKLYDLDLDYTESIDQAEKNPGVLEEIEFWVLTTRDKMAEQKEPEMPKGKKFR
ncbi:MAG: arylsulfatase [Bacteroidota bacterium]